MIVRRSISIVMAVAMFLVAGAVAVAEPGEGDFVSRINADRASNGLDPLTVLSGLTTYARSHSEAMEADGQIYHSTADQLRSMANSAAPGWQRLGENVGTGGSVASLHVAFMNSPGHRDNILGDFTHVGVGTVESDGRLYVTEIFVKLPAGSTTTSTTTSTTSTTTTTAPETTTAPTTTDSPTTTTAPTTTESTTTTPPTTEPPTTTTDGSTPPPTEPPTTTTPPETTAAPTTESPATTEVAGGPIPTSGPKAPGAADTVRLVASIVLGATVVLFLLALRRRGGIAAQR